jgi:hypothetical protein
MTIYNPNLTPILAVEKTAIVITFKKAAINTQVRQNNNQNNTKQNPVCENNIQGKNKIQIQFFFFLYFLIKSLNRYRIFIKKNIL